MEFFDEAECWSRDQIEQTQLSRLRSTVAQTRKCDFYRQRLDEAGVGPDSIRSLDDLRRIPFTTKQDLRSQYPTGLLCVPQSEIVRMRQRRACPATRRKADRNTARRQGCNCGRAGAFGGIA